jgi:quercetin dioxygenase-like cupin family protein
MKTHVLFLGLFLLSTVVAMANPSTPSLPVMSSAEYPLTVGGTEYDLVTIVQDFPAGAGIGTHGHEGWLLVMVMTGAITLHESGADRVVKAGESWTESPGNLYSVINKGPGPARMAESGLLPRGAAIAIMKMPTE